MLNNEPKVPGDEPKVPDDEPKVPDDEPMVSDDEPEVPKGKGNGKGKSKGKGPDGPPPGDALLGPRNSKKANRLISKVSLTLLYIYGKVQCPARVRGRT